MATPTIGTPQDIYAAMAASPYGANSGWSLAPASSATAGRPSPFSYTPGMALPPDVLAYLKAQTGQTVGGALQSTNGYTFAPTFSGGSSSLANPGEAPQFAGVGINDGKQWYQGQNEYKYNADGTYGGFNPIEDPTKSNWVDKYGPIIPLMFVGGAMAAGAAGGAAGGAGLGSGAATGADMSAFYGGLDGGATLGGGATTAGEIGAAGAGTSVMGAGGGAVDAAGGFVGDATAAGYGGLDAASTATMGGGATTGELGAASSGISSALSSMGVTPAQLASSPGLMQQVAQALGVSPQTLTSLIGPAINAVGGALGAGAAKDAAQSAASAQLNAAQLGIDEQRRQFDTVRGLLQPYVGAGTSAVALHADLLGMNGADKQQAAYNMIQASPAFQSQMNLAQNRILANASATGGIRGGNTQGALGYLGPQILSQLISGQLSGLGGLSSLGESAAAGVGNAGMATGQGVSNLLQQGGAAQAGADIAGGVATQKLYGSIASGIGQYFGYGGGLPSYANTPIPV